MFILPICIKSDLDIGKIIVELLQITWCDFAFAVSLENFEIIFGKSSLDRYPALKALKEKIYDLPSITDWINKRPVTES
ncbi:glutathione s-transferase c-terminal domain superfamily [Holotrichia oblita]|uniref:Glutathione s-transferase c-terminal domain superfamily n=1 Tax=Holotrichia oblita TaxID=644536 RepID=A0ACB9TUI8_HOLOL|nr:glutathione s-transferase c-terminal domain superfamily [Holotrichia oblita]